MNFSELARVRRSVHHFEPNRSIDDETLFRIIDTTRYTPSGYNAQPWEFVFIRDRDKIAELKTICFDQDHVADASAICIVVWDKRIVSDPEKLSCQWRDAGYITEEQRIHWLPKMKMQRAEQQVREMVIRNCAFASMSLLYAAAEQGIACCPIMGVSKPKLERYLNLPDDRMMVLVILMGYEQSGHTPPRLPRKSIYELCHFEHFGNHPETAAKTE